MVKKRGKPAAGNRSETQESRPGRAQAAVLGFAEELGRVLGTTERKATEWLQQREAIAQQLTQIRETAGKYLAQLAAGANIAVLSVRRGRRGRPPGTANKQSGAPDRSRKQRRSRMTAAQRKAVGDRMRKYWAERRKAEGKSK